MSWILNLLGGAGSAIGSAGEFVGKGASSFHQGVGQGTGLWGGQAGTQPGGAMIKSVGGGIQPAQQTGWGKVANQLGQMSGNYMKSQSGGIDFGAPKARLSSQKEKTTMEKILEMAGRE